MIRNDIKKREADDTIQSMYNKGDGQVIRLAMLLSLLAWAPHPEMEEPKQIERIYVERAIKLVETYFQPHAVRLRAEANVPAEDSKAGKLVKHIKRNNLRTFNAREVRQVIFGKSAKDGEDMNAAVKHLEDACLIWPANKAKRAGRGRPASNYEANPLIWGAPQSQDSAA
jgi:hypothetical protein